MLTLNESKAQRWRVVAMLNDGTQVLVYVGSSIAQVRENFPASWLEYVHEGVRADTKKLMIQKWVGSSDCGRWHNQSEVRKPVPKEQEKVA